MTSLPQTVGSPAQFIDCELYDRLFEEILPSSFEHRIKRATKYAEHKLDIVVICNVKNKDDARNWLSAFQALTKTTWSIRTCPETSGKRVIFKQYLGCFHNGRIKKLNSCLKVRVRNTNCPSAMSITIQATNLLRPSRRKSAAPDPDFPCEIYLRLNHNHSTDSSEILRFRRVSEKVKDKLKDLFKRGHSAATALDTIKIDLQIDNPDRFEELLADRHHCPDYQFCYRMYKEFSDKSPPTDHKFLMEKLEEFNAQSQTQSAAWHFTTEEVIIVLCTPLMRRAHQLTPQSAEIVFIDPSSTVGRNGHHIFTLVTQNESGGVPLGIFITSSTKAVTLTRALAMLKDLLGADGFYGSSAGPTVFMSNDSENQQNSLSAVWPAAIILLSQFHILQAMWRWLTDTKHGIRVPETDRMELYRTFKEIIFASTEDECNHKYLSLKTNLTVKRNKNFSDHVASHYWERRTEWAVCYRTNMGGLVCENNISNFDESAMRILKDKVFKRVKIFNLSQLTAYIITSLEHYRERKLLDAADNKNTVERLSKEWLEPSAMLLERIQPLGNNIFRVPCESGSESYLVDAELHGCECPIGAKGAMCQHQVWLALKLDEPLAATRTIDVRRRLFIIASGKEPSSEWMLSLRCKPEIKEEIMDTDPLDGNLAEVCEIQPPNWEEMGQDIWSSLSTQIFSTHPTSSEDVYNALLKMKSNLSQIKTAHELVSALATFGQVSGKQQCSSKQIPVKPSVIARRGALIVNQQTSVRGQPCMTNPVAKVEPMEHSY